MKTKFIKSIIACLAIICLSLVPISAFAANTTCSANVCSGSYPDSVKAACGCSNVKDNLSTVIQKVLNGIIGVAGVVSVIYVIVGGVQYMTSAGDTGKLEKAKKTILYALIGLAVCALSFAIVNFAVSTINKANKTSSIETTYAAQVIPLQASRG